MDEPFHLVGYLKRKDGTYITPRRKTPELAIGQSVPRRFGWGEGDEPAGPAMTALPTILEIPRLNFNVDVDGPPELDAELPDLDLNDLIDGGFPDPGFGMPNLDIPDLGVGDFPLDGIEFPNMGDALGPCGPGGMGDFGDCGPSPGTGSGVGGMGPGVEDTPGGTTDAIGTGITAGKETFDEDKCFPAGTPIVDAIDEIGSDLGLDPSQLSVDGTCDAELENEKCFPKGSSKWDALWWLSDQCGMVPIDDGSGDVVIAPITPLDTIWTLNEYTNLFEFIPNADSSELFAYVEVFRASVTQGGTVVSTPLSVIVEVPSPFSADPQEVFRISVDPGVTVSEATALAKSTAARMGRTSYRISATTFFNPEIKLRHQIKIQRPSKDYEETFMCTSITHDISETGKYTTVEAQVILPDPVLVGF